MNDFYKQKYYVIESFYEHIIEEHYTIEQATDRCLVEFWKQISDGGLDALAVYSTIFYRVARHSEKGLKRFKMQISDMNCLLSSEACQKIPQDDLEELTDEISFINQKLG